MNLDSIAATGGDPDVAQLYQPETQSLSIGPPIDQSEIAQVGQAPTLPYLTPDSMLIYCQSRLSGVDAQCQEIMSRQEKTNRDQNSLAELSGIVNKYPEGFDNEGKRNELKAAYATAIDKVGATSDLGIALAKEAKILDVEGDNKVGKEDMGGLINALKQHQSTLNSTSELDMIRLQSLVSQRQTAVQLTTNIVQSLNDQANKIVANIR